ncbi:MAG TPA: hypothetical protein VLC53_01180, partial [Myxococcota bacterium]|nr:hypothetical protein [Myxococcota bacterium]
MAQHSKKAPADTLAQLESLGDRLIGWVSSNPALVLGTAVAILLVAATIGGTRAWRNSAADEASAGLAAIQREYVMAMGGEATDMEAPEPANPETARQVRTEYVERFASFAREHAGTPAQALAALEASRIYEALGPRSRRGRSCSRRPTSCRTTRRSAASCCAGPRSWPRAPGTTRLPPWRTSPPP